jgi:hypothetical protein
LSPAGRRRFPTQYHLPIRLRRVVNAYLIVLCEA